MVFEYYFTKAKSLRSDEVSALESFYKIPNDGSTLESRVARIALKNPFVLVPQKPLYFLLENSNLTFVPEPNIRNFSVFTEKEREEATFSLKDVYGLIDGTDVNKPYNLDTDINNDINTLNSGDDSKSSSPYNFLRLKLKYEPKRGINSFLSLIETFSSTYNITDPKQKVNLALLALENSDQGLTVKQIVSSEERLDWNLFKTRLQSLLGKDSDSYRDDFDNWQNLSDPPTLALAKLITIYKFSFDPPKRSLSKQDEQCIIRKYIKSFSQPVRGFLLAEIDQLNLNNLGNRTIQLQRAFQTNVNYINYVDTAVNDEKIDISQNNKNIFNSSQETINSELEKLKILLK